MATIVLEREEFVHDTSQQCASQDKETCQSCAADVDGVGDQVADIIVA